MSDIKPSFIEIGNFRGEYSLDFPNDGVVIYRTGASGNRERIFQGKITGDTMAELERLQVICDALARQIIQDGYHLKLEQER